jgi:Cu(I)/Ag(I) efflux system membrane fusion protein
MPEEDIRRLKATRKIQTRFTLKAPIDGVITAFDLRSGMNITKDNVVAKIQGMDPVWISAAVPESIAWLLKDSSQFTISVPAWPGKPSPSANGRFCPAQMPRPARYSYACRWITPMRCSNRG